VQDGIAPVDGLGPTGVEPEVRADDGQTPIVELGGRVEL